MVNVKAYHSLVNELKPGNIQLLAVSKLQPAQSILQLYNEGQRDFGENYVQEMLEKQEVLPNDIRWHFIGHLQSNKVKYIASFVHLIHGVDSEKLLLEINKQAAKNGRVINCLLQVHIAQEETKFGFDPQEAAILLEKLIAQPSALTHICIRGLMGMASFTENTATIRSEFKILYRLFQQFHSRVSFFDCLSMGMTSDYTIAAEEGTTMVRVGSLIFGDRK